jgi:hypothetical protein
LQLWFKNTITKIKTLYYINNSYHESILHAVDHIHEFCQRIADAGVSGDVPLVNVEAERRAVTQVVPLEIGYNEIEPAFFVSQCRAVKEIV